MTDFLRPLEVNLQDSVVSMPLPWPVVKRCVPYPSAWLFPHPSPWCHVSLSGLWQGAGAQQHGRGCAFGFSPNRYFKCVRAVGSSSLPRSMSPRCMVPVQLLVTGKYSGSTVCVCLAALSCRRARRGKPGSAPL